MGMFMLNAIRSLALFLVLLLTTTGAQALTLWDNGPPTLDENAWNFGNTIGDDFNLSVDSTTESIDFYFYAISGQTQPVSNIVLRLDGNEIAVDSVLVTGQIGTMTCCGQPVFGATVDFTDTVLSAGTHSVQLSLSQPTAFLGWIFTPGYQLERSTINGTPHSTGSFAATDVAFTLYGTPVPEPSTALLMGLGLVAMGVRRRGSDGDSACSLSLRSPDGDRPDHK
jgi:hypothetical protein